MRVQTFIGKSSNEGLHQMDEHINEWLKRTGVTPAFVKQSAGNERYHGGEDEPIVVVSIWYNENA